MKDVFNSEPALTGGAGASIDVSFLRRVKTWAWFSVFFLLLPFFYEATS